MKKKYCIGFFVAFFVFVSLLGIGYQVSYQYVMDRQVARQQDKQRRSVAVKGEAEDIPFEELPKEVQTSVKQKKYVETEEELYAFLENYSS